MVELCQQSRSDLELTNDEPLVSVVMPCLNEERTVAECVQQARRALEAMGVTGEIVVSDNGSTDGSVALAQQAGARVVHCPHPGYGNAVRFGVEHSQGHIVLMGDADASYDFSSIERFIRPLQDGADLVMGNRFQGGIRPGAMPWKNRYLGNPVLTSVLNLLFDAGIGDAHCGLRGFTRSAFQRMQLESTGMELASEIVVKAAKGRMEIIEVPTTLDCDGRDRPPHLSPWRDGWRHLKFLFMFSPVHLFLLPALILTLLGLLMLLLSTFGPTQFGNVYHGIHWMVLGALLTLLGLQVTEFGILARLYTVKHRFDERDPVLEWMRRSLRLEAGLLIAVGLFVCGAIVNCWILVQWIASDFGALERVAPALVATVLMAVSAQLAFFFFLFAIINESVVSRDE